MKLGILKSFKDKRVLLLGDVILDVYIYGRTVGQALYAAVPEIEEQKTVVSFGGNGLVAANILELGGSVHFFSVVGADEYARHYDALVHKKLKKHFFVDPTRQTTVKRRWYADGKALLQANVVDNHEISAALEKKILKGIASHIHNVDVVVVMDPQHGLLTKTLIQQVKNLCVKHKKPMYVDAQISHRESNHHLYRGVDCIFLNEKEATAVHPKFNMREPEQSLRDILEKLQLNNIVVKLGHKGSCAILNGQFVKSRPHKVSAVDPCGAGDAFLAAFSLGDRERPEDSLQIANIWAALSTEIHGTIPPRKKQIFDILTED